MEFKDREFIPVLLGGDINTYSVARAFYEQYQVKTYIFGKFATGPSYGSKIIEYHPNPKIDTDDYFLQTVNPQNTFVRRFKSLLCRYPNVDIEAMGFTPHWEQEPLWRS